MEPANWLVLSLKWSRGDSEWLVWYRPNASGYTTNIREAGRYTETEAKGHEMEDVTLAVPEPVALDSARTMTVVEAGAVVVDRFRDARKGIV